MSLFVKKTDSENKFYVTLRMGDLIYTGTPAGVGPVSPGDNLRAVLEGRELLNFDIR